MKAKIILLMLLCMTAKAACAQEASVQTQEPVKEKKFTITPRTGMAISRFGGDFAFYVDKKAIKYVSGVTVGADVEYQFNKLLGVSLGAYYMQEGGKLDNYNVGLGGEYDLFRYTDRRIQKKVLSVPLTLKVHTPLTGLSVYAGAGVNRVFSARHKAHADMYFAPANVVNLDGSITNRPSQRFVYDSNDDISNLLSKWEVFGVAGLSYAYKDVVLDVRYNYGFSNIDKNRKHTEIYFDKYNNTFHGREIKQHTVMLTLGYQLHL